MSEVKEILENKEKEKKTLKDFLLDVFDIISFLVFVWGIVLFIRFFLFNPYTVVGESMEPTFHQQDFIIVDKISPQFQGFKRGDIVVFVPPGKDNPYIKRIIWLPGETIKIMSGDVFVCEEGKWSSCRKLEEPYLSEGVSTSTEKCWIKEFDVTSWAYFVLWDNRDHSTDSRCCFWIWCYGESSYLLPENYIIWKASLKLLPDFNIF